MCPKILLFLLSVATAPGLISGLLPRGYLMLLWKKHIRAGEKWNGWRCLPGKNLLTGQGEWLPQETIDDFQEYLVGIKGPLTTPVGGGIRSLNVALRQMLDLYVCLRPVKYVKGVPSPVKHPELVDMVIFRENTEDIYAGIEWKSGSPEAEKVIRFLQEEMKINKIRFPETSGIGIKPVSEEGSKRLIRAAIRYALEENRNPLPWCIKAIL